MILPLEDTRCLFVLSYKGKLLNPSNSFHPTMPSVFVRETPKYLLIIYLPTQEITHHPIQGGLKNDFSS